jgi:hypothetical protein
MVADRRPREHAHVRCETTRRKSILVQYALRSRGDVPGALARYFQRHDGWAHIMGGSWMLATDKSPQQVLREVLEIVGPDDQVLAVDVTENAMAWRGLGTQKDLWLSQAA